MNNILQKLAGMFGVNQNIKSPVTDPNNMMKSPYNFPTDTQGQDSLAYYYAHQGAPSGSSYSPTQQVRQQPSPTPQPTTHQQQATPMPPRPTVTQQYNQTGIPGFTTTPVPQNIAPIIIQASQKTGINPAVLASLLFSEHGFQADQNMTPNYDSKGNFLGYDRGIAQINSQSHPDVSNSQAFDPNFAIPWAANLLKNYIGQTGTLKQGIAAYNVGPGGATVYGKGSGKLGPKGQQYLGKIEHGISPDVISQLGL